MLDGALEVLGNSHFEAYIGGPFAGVVAGLIFSAMGSRPLGSSATGQSPHDTLAVLEQSIGQASRLRDERRSNHQQRTTAETRDNANVFFMLAVVLVVVAVFLFGAFLPQIAFALNFFISFAAISAMTTSLMAITTGQFNSANWWRHSVSPLLLSVGCMFVAARASSAIRPEVVGFAHGLLGEDWSFKTVMNGAITFYKTLSSDYVLWMILEMSAFVSVAICAVFALLQCVYYVALSNTRVADSTKWVRLAIATARFGNLRSLVTAWVLLIAAWFMATGDIYALLHR